MPPERLPEFSPEFYDDLRDRLRTHDKDGAIEIYYQLLSAGRSVGEIISEVGSLPNSAGNENAFLKQQQTAPLAPAESAATEDRLPAGRAAAPDSDRPGAAPRRSAARPIAFSILYIAAVATASIASYSMVGRMRGVEVAGDNRHPPAVDQPASAATADLANAATGPATAGQAAAAGQPVVPEPPKPDAPATTPGPAAVAVAIPGPPSAAAAPAEPVQDSPPGGQASAEPPAQTPPAPAAGEPVAPAVAAIPPVAREPAPAVSEGKRSPHRLSPQETAVLRSRADAVLHTGDVTSARLFYRLAAEGGDGTAALRLGATFDPAFLAEARLGRIAGDVKQALYWYRRARDLGNSDAEILLKRMEPARK